MKFEKEIAMVLKSRRPESDMIDIIEALGYASDKYQQAFEIALEMDNRNLAKFLYSNFNSGKVVVELMLLGKR